MWCAYEFPHEIQRDTGSWDTWRCRKWSLPGEPCLGGWGCNGRHVASLSTADTLEGSKRVLSRRKYFQVISSYSPGRHPRSPHGRAVGLCETRGPSLIKAPCLHLVRLMFFWQRRRIVTVSCLLSVWSAPQYRPRWTAVGSSVGEAPHCKNNQRRLQDFFLGD